MSTKNNKITKEGIPSTDFNIELSEEMSEGVYSNLSIITHSQSEFVIDFINVMPSTPKSKVKARIVMTPLNIKRMMRAIQDNIAKFEAVNGSIPEPQELEIPLNFGIPTAQA